MNWTNYYRIALINMKKSRHDRAVVYFQRAADKCRLDKDKVHLEKILLYMGMSLKKSGYPNRALKSWYLGSLLVKKGRSNEMYLHNVNDYGFHKNNSQKTDDWQAFFAIQLKKYLLSKTHSKKLSAPEFDMITDLISSHWDDLNEDYIMADLCSWDKIQLFTSVKIVFPVTRIDEGLPANIIPFRVFNEKKMEEEYCVITTQKKNVNLMHDFLSVLL